MRGLNTTEIELVCGGEGYPEPPMDPGVPQWQWDELKRLIEEQNKRNGQQQN